MIVLIASTLCASLFSYGASQLVYGAQPGAPLEVKVSGSESQNKSVYLSERRERIATQILAGMYAHGDTSRAGAKWALAYDARAALAAADALIAAVDCESCR